MTLGSIGGSGLGSAGDSIEEPSITSKTYIVLVVACSNHLGYARDSSAKGSSLTSKTIIVLGVVVILRPVEVFVGIEFKTHFAKSVTRYLNYLVCHGPFLIELSQELSPTKQNKQDQQKVVMF